MGTMTLKGSAFFAVGFLATACRGTISHEPPVHLQQNMHFQTSFKPQEENDFFDDRRAMRPEVADTVARGSLQDDDKYYKGMVGEDYVKEIPAPLTMQLVQRGQNRFNIYCTPCHSKTAMGNGTVVQRGMVPPPNLVQDDRVLHMPVGYYFNVISHGVRSMPPYGHAIPIDDRWAIVSYLRALQLSHNARIEDVPPDVAASKGWLVK